MNRSVARAVAARVPACVIAFAVSSAGAREAVATEWWVDAVLGSDSNGGTSPADSWRTITHALATIPFPPPFTLDTIHAAPGVYDAAIGESFPLAMRAGISLVGDQGSAVTSIVQAAPAGSETTVVRFGTDAWGFYPGPTLSGFTITGGREGILDTAGVFVVLEDLQLVGNVDGGFVSNVAILSANYTFDRCVVRGNGGHGVDVDFVPNTFLGGFVSVTLRDSTVDGNTRSGVQLTAAGSGFAPVNFGFEVERSVVAENGEWGVRAVGPNLGPGTSSFSGEVRNSLVARNGIGGIHASGMDDPSAFTCSFATIADDGGLGVELLGPDVATLAATIESTILWGNGDDLIYGPTVSMDVSTSDVEDGDFAGQSGNISADPLFADASNLDYEPLHGSPCADTGSFGAVGTGTPDLAGVVRPVDGDLDAAETPDMGAYERVDLRVPSVAPVGTTVDLELTGPAGKISFLLLAAGGLVGPFQTAFGELDLPIPGAIGVGVFAVQPSPPATISLDVPANPALVGLAVSFQSFGQSSIAPYGAAFTNAVTTTFVP